MSFVLAPSPRLGLDASGQHVWQSQPPRLESPAFPIEHRERALREDPYADGIGFRISRPLDDGELGYASDLGRRWADFYQDDNPELPLYCFRNYGELVADDRRAICFWMDRVTLTGDPRVHVELALWLANAVAALLPVASVSFDVDPGEALSASAEERFGRPLLAIGLSAASPPALVTFLLAYAPLLLARWLSAPPALHVLAYALALALPIALHRSWFGCRPWLLWSGVAAALLDLASPLLYIALPEGSDGVAILSTTLRWSIRAWFLALLVSLWRDRR